MLIMPGALILASGSLIAPKHRSSPGELTTMAGRRIRFVPQSLEITFCLAESSHHFLFSYLDHHLYYLPLYNCSEAIRAKLISSGILGSDAYVVIAGPANTYAHYVTTREEYSVQRYEGASTIFGQCKFPFSNIR
jgi:hypothetical protein